MPHHASAQIDHTQRLAHAFVPRRFSGVFIRGEPPNKKTTRQRVKTGEFERRRFALLGFPEGLANQDSVPPFNGGTGGRNPQIRVLPTLGKSKPTDIYRLSLRLLQQLTDPSPNSHYESSFYHQIGSCDTTIFTI